LSVRACVRASSGARVKRVRDMCEAELRDLERSERAAVEKQQQLRKVQVETEGELIRLQGHLRQRDQEMEAVVQVRKKRGSRNVNPLPASGPLNPPTLIN